MATGLKLKVKVAELIEAIEKRRDEVKAQHEADNAKLADELVQWRATCERILKEAGERLREDGHPVPDRRTYGYSNYLEFPLRPEPRKVDTTGYDRSIAQLKMAAEEVISISAEDYARYVR